MGLVQELYEQMRYSRALVESVTPAPAPVGVGPNPTAGAEDPNADPSADPAMAEPAIDADDDIMSVDHPANHPAVHAAHASFIITHDALADDPTPENMALHQQSWEALQNALSTYAFNTGDGMEVTDPNGAEEEIDPEDPNAAPGGEQVTEEADETEGADDPAPDDEGDDAGDGGEEKKKNPFKKSESNPYIATNAQKHGIKGMNTAAYTNPHNLKIEYVSEDQTPWHINSGSTPLGKAASYEAAEHMMSEITAMAARPMEMSGKEGDYTKSLLPGAPGNTDVSWGSVIGDENQNFTPPNVAGPGVGGPWRGEPQPRRNESAPGNGPVLPNPWAKRHPSSYSQSAPQQQASHSNMYGGNHLRESRGGGMVLANPFAGIQGQSNHQNNQVFAADNLPPELAVPMHPSFANLPRENVLAGNPAGQGGAPVNARAHMAQFTESSSFMCSDTPSLMQLAAGYEYQPKDLNAHKQHRQTESVAQPQAVPQASVPAEVPQRIRETACPNCSGSGCHACGQEGAVSHQEAKAFRESQDANGVAYGSHLMWSPKLPKQAFSGNYKPSQSSDPMVRAYDRINQSRRSYNH